MKNVFAPSLVLAAALWGCAEVEEEQLKAWESLVEKSSGSAVVDQDATLFLYYGAYRGYCRRIPAEQAGQHPADFRAELDIDGDGHPDWYRCGGADSAPNMHLLPRVNGRPNACRSDAEHVMALKRPLPAGGEPWPDTWKWRDAGGKLALAVNEDEFVDHFAGRGEAGVELAIQAFSRGIHYLAIDEVAAVEGSNAGARRLEAWRNGSDLAAAFRTFAEALAARGFERRLILYLNAYNMARDRRITRRAPYNQGFSEFSEVLTTCRDHCRVLAAEVYVSTGRVRGIPGARPSPKRCNWNMGCFDRVAVQVDAVARCPDASVEAGTCSPLLGRTITVLGASTVNRDYTSPNYEAALCDGPGGKGGLRRQYERLRSHPKTEVQPGVGFYSLSQVPRGPEGRVSRPALWRNFDIRQAQCIRSLNASRLDWPRAGGGGGPTRVIPGRTCP